MSTAYPNSNNYPESEPNFPTPKVMTTKPRAGKKAIVGIEVIILVYDEELIFGFLFLLFYSNFGVMAKNGLI